MTVSPYGFLLAAGLSAAMLAGCGKTDPAKTPGKGGAPSRSVRVVPATRRPMAHSIAVTGTVAAREKSVLSAKVPGRLQHLAVDIGSVVRQGELLAQVEPRDYELGMQQARAAVAQARTVLGLPPEGEDDHIELELVTGVKQAKALLEEATKNRDRVKRLSQSGIASQAELDTVEAAYTVAFTSHDTSLEQARSRLAALAQRRVDLELAAKQLADASVLAPFDGAIQGRPANVGEYLAAGTPILELVKTDPLRLKLQVPERECTLVRTGQVVQLLVEGDTNAYPGRIARLSPALDEQNRMLLVEADVPCQGSLRPGLFARAQIILSDNEAALSVPAEALSVFAGLEKVVVVQNGKALEKVVTTGRHGPGWAEILSGLSAGEEVVLNPGGLRTSQPVTISTETQNRAAAQAGKDGPSGEPSPN